MITKIVIPLHLNFFIISFFVITVADCLRSNYTGSQVLKVKIDRNGFVRRIIESEDLDVWSENVTHVDVHINSEKLIYIKEGFEKNKITYKTVIQDVQSLIDNQNLPASKQVKGMNWQEYHRLKAIHEYLDDLADRYTDIASVGVVGYSIEGRPLKYIKISSGQSNAGCVLIDGGIHAREWISPASATYIIKQLVENRASLPKEMLSLDFYILPVSNPDGYEFSHTADRLWRKNRAKGRKCPGVDLNRNFDFGWGGKGSSDSECTEIFRGKSPASEPETRAIQNFIWDLKNNLKAYITFHSYGQYILIPYGFNVGALPDDFDEMKILAKTAASAINMSNGAHYTVGNTAAVLYVASGGSEDWAKGQVGVKYSYCIELRDTGDFGFLLPTSLIIPSAADAFVAIKVIAKAVAAL